MAERTAPDLKLPDSGIAKVLDLRLHSAFSALREFQTRNAADLTNLGQLDPAKAASLANELSSSVFKSLRIEPNGQSPELVDPEKVDKIAKAIESDGTKVVIVRHAEQSPPEWVFTIPQADLRKIRMMQNPFNREDLITNKSLSEVFSTSFILCYLGTRAGKNIKMFSSENMRALEIAKVVSQMSPDSSVAVEGGLSCVTYKDESDDPGVTVEQILAEIPSGYMPWNPELVDKLCRPMKNGHKPSDSIKDAIGTLFAKKDDPNGNDLIIVLTHSQQLAEVLNLAGKLTDPAVRLPELSMIVATQDECLVLERGVLLATEKTKPPRRKDLRKILEKQGEGYQWYKVRRSEFKTPEKIPFLVSPEPLILTNNEGAEILAIGQDVVAYMNACNELFGQDANLANLLKMGKPGYLLEARKAKYLFVRPDLIITDKGFSICEIETSPFGLALAELLNRAYQEAGFTTLVNSGTLRQFLADNTPDTGRVVFSQHTVSYEGQLKFLAKELLSSDQRNWEAQHIDQIVGTSSTPVYRGFYIHEALSDLFIHDLVTGTNNPDITPSLTPHMEEKALLSLIWDKRYEEFFTQKLGSSTVDHLRRVVPPTWIMGQEEFFAGQLPEGVTNSADLANLPKSKRLYVLKTSGFGPKSSWTKGVNFLQEKSQPEAARLLTLAARDTSTLYIIQEFHQGQKRPMFYEEKGSRKLVPMEGRVRITPYFSMVEGSAGQMVAIKATACENTNYIHAGTGSINTAISTRLK